MSVKQLCNYCKRQRADKGVKYCDLTARDCKEYEVGSDCVNWKSKKGLKQ